MRLSDTSLSDDGMIKPLRQIVLHVQEFGQITNSEVQQICGVSKATASRYLAELEANYIQKIGLTGKGTHYVLKGSLWAQK